MKSIKIIKKKLEERLYYENQLMVSLNVEYPQIWCPHWAKGANDFNTYYFLRAQELQLFAKKELYNNAVQDYNFAKEQGYPFNNYTLFQTYKITCCEDSVISLFRDIYQYTGGAHGITDRSGETWNLFLAQQLELADLFIGNIDYRAILIQSITEQAIQRQDENPGIYFDNIEENIIKYFDKDNFYLTYEGIAIFYPLYTIGPYVSGIQVFITPYEYFL